MTTQTSDVILEQQSKSIGEQLAGKHMTFRLGNEDYGIEILKVQEIIQMQAITTVPRSPSFMRGVINLRGKVIPVIELRKKFGLEACEDNDETCIIVVQVETSDKPLTIGIIIDAVEEVLDIQTEQIEDPPAMGASVDTAFIMGMGKIGDSVKILLDIDKVLSFDEMNGMACSV